MTDYERGTKAYIGFCITHGANPLRRELVDFARWALEEHEELKRLTDGRCLVTITDRNDGHQMLTCMLARDHDTAHSDGLGATWTDAAHWKSDTPLVEIQSVTMWRCATCGKWSHAVRRPKHHQRIIFEEPEDGVVVLSEETTPIDYTSGEGGETAWWISCGPFEEWTAYQNKKENS